MTAKVQEIDSDVVNSFASQLRGKIVLADGSFVIVNASQNMDLF